MCVSEICCHRRGASRDFERSRFTSRDHSGVPVVQNHWQSVESAAFRSWPFKIPSARADQHVSFFFEALYFYPRGDVLKLSFFLRGIFSVLDFGERRCIELKFGNYGV